MHLYIYIGTCRTIDTYGCTYIGRTLSTYIYIYIYRYIYAHLANLLPLSASKLRPFPATNPVMALASTPTPTTKQHKSILNIAPLIIYILAVAPREDTADRILILPPHLSTSVIPYCCRLL